MAKFILAQKKEMTQKFAQDGMVIPVTRVIAGPCVVTQIKTGAKDGYTAVQLGFGKKKNLSKPIKGHLKNLGNFQYLKEFRVADQDSSPRFAGEAGEKLAVGKILAAKIFIPGDIVKISGVSKGKGFQGVVKRHGFSGSPATHGHKDQLRMPGSIGASGPQHVMKGTRMPGRMGGNSVTVKNLKVVEVNPTTNEIFIKGALPGAKDTLLLISGIGDLVIESEVGQEEQDNIETLEQENKKAKKQENTEIKNVMDNKSNNLPAAS